jgi:hypothetical protein
MLAREINPRSRNTRRVDRGILKAGRTAAADIQTGVEARAGAGGGGAFFARPMMVVTKQQMKKSRS